MTPSFASLRGAPYFYLDADGEWVSSMCNGVVVTDFRLASGSPGDWVMSCKTGLNPPSDDATSEYSTVGIVSGGGFVRRWGQSQPTWPGYFNCGSGPCVYVAGGSQNVRIEPIATVLTLAANKTSVLAGDSVLFTPSASGLSISVIGWYWVPDSVVGKPSVSPRTGTCSSSTSSCKVPVFETGRMYLRALVGSGSSAVEEQASARVSVACGSGDPLFDSRELRDEMKRMMLLSNADDTVTYRRSERMRLVYRKNGVYKFVDPPAYNPNPCRVGFYPPQSNVTVDGDTLVSWIHTHPYGPNEVLQCGDPAAYPAQDTSRIAYVKGANPQDLSFMIMNPVYNLATGSTTPVTNPALKGLPMFVIDKQYVMFYKPPSQGGDSKYQPLYEYNWKSGVCAWP
ncbi:MAG: hypothetical protein K2R93_14365 [Gemmatimonadaceae bacterium]|nr:hypothetical protein [Gemmatimonadaceae bacterium]